jgi:hypothetical protein
MPRQQIINIYNIISELDVAERVVRHGAADVRARHHLHQRLQVRSAPEGAAAPVAGGQPRVVHALGLRFRIHRNPHPSLTWKIFFFILIW